MYLMNYDIHFKFEKNNLKLKILIGFQGNYKTKICILYITFTYIHIHTHRMKYHMKNEGIAS